VKTVGRSSARSGANVEEPAEQQVVLKLLEKARSEKRTEYSATERAFRAARRDRRRPLGDSCRTFDERSRQCLVRQPLDGSAAGEAVGTRSSRSMNASIVNCRVAPPSASGRPSLAAGFHGTSGRRPGR